MRCCFFFCVCYSSTTAVDSRKWEPSTPTRSSVHRGIVPSPKTLGAHKISAQAQPEQGAPRGACLSP